MDKASFSNLIFKVYNYFRLQKLPSTDQVELWYNEVKYIPETAIDEIFSRLAHEDSLPRNLPKVIKGVYAGLPKAKRKKFYDKYDDPEYPVENLHTAFEILERDGKEAFIAYCRAVKMPLQDIERVRNKFQYCFDAADLTREIGI